MASNLNSPVSSSKIVGITGMNHQHLAQKEHLNNNPCHVYLLRTAVLKEGIQIQNKRAMAHTARWTGTGIEMHFIDLRRKNAPGSLL
jgi:hypothetical protein